jgi:hypothetical protein
LHLHALYIYVYDIQKEGKSWIKKKKKCGICLFVFIVRERMKECEEMSTLKNEEKEKEIIHVCIANLFYVVNKVFFLCFEYVQTIFSCMCVCITPTNK